MTRSVDSPDQKFHTCKLSVQVSGLLSDLGLQVPDSGWFSQLGISQFGKDATICSEMCPWVPMVPSEVYLPHILCEIHSLRKENTVSR